MNNLSKYVNAKGDFEFPNFLYQSINRLMKSTLDLGNLACSDANQLRAFKETVKRNFKSEWQTIAKMLMDFDIIVPCTCSDNEYCTECGGSRFLPNDIFSSDVLQEVELVVTDTQNPETKEKLKEGLVKILKDGLIDFDEARRYLK